MYFLAFLGERKRISDVAFRDYFTDSILMYFWDFGVWYLSFQASDFRAIRIVDVVSGGF
jgi:hypothetical protein